MADWSSQQRRSEDSGGLGDGQQPGVCSDFGARVGCSVKLGSGDGQADSLYRQGHQMRRACAATVQEEIDSLLVQVDRDRVNAGQVGEPGMELGQVSAFERVADEPQHGGLWRQRRRRGWEDQLLVIARGTSASRTPGAGRGPSRRAQPEAIFGYGANAMFGTEVVGPAERRRSAERATPGAFCVHAEIIIRAWKRGGQSAYPALAASDG